MNHAYVHEQAGIVKMAGYEQQACNGDSWACFQEQAGNDNGQGHVLESGGDGSKPIQNPAAAHAEVLRQAVEPLTGESSNVLYPATLHGKASQPGDVGRRRSWQKIAVRAG